MKDLTVEIISDFFEKHQYMQYLKPVMLECVQQSAKRINDGGKILLCGNGGSAADCEHIAGELLKEFYIKRPVPQSFKKKLEFAGKDLSEYYGKTLQRGIPAISLVSQCGIISAFANDAAADMAYAQQVYAYAADGDIFIGLSTSGNSANVFHAANVAKACGCYTVGFTGETGGKLKQVCDQTLNAPAKETYQVQEYHLPLYHLYCMCVENEMFGE